MMVNNITQHFLDKMKYIKPIYFIQHRHSISFRFWFFFAKVTF